jgi:hypothetical protein
LFENIYSIHLFEICSNYFDSFGQNEFENSDLFENGLKFCSNLFKKNVQKILFEKLVRKWKREEKRNLGLTI